MPGEAGFDPLLGMHYTVNRSGWSGSARPESIKDIELEMTILGGRIVHQKDDTKKEETKKDDPYKEGIWPFTNRGS
jgi:predicted amidohydrolase YtcJ